jgi:Family of unknown function (DUF6370)
MTHRTSMKNILLACSLLLATVALPLYADTTTKFSGTAVCAKCALHQTDECQMAIKMKDTNGKEETLLVENNKIAQDFHKNICKKDADVNAEGTISEQGGKKVVTLKKIMLAK